MNESMEDTIDLQEFINYDPAARHNLWVSGAPKRDVPVLDFIDAIISKDLALVSAAGFLLEKVLLPAPVYSVFTNKITKSPAVKAAGPPTLVDFYAKISGSTGQATLRSLHDLRAYWQDIRSLSTSNLIQFYVFDAALHWTLQATARLLVDTPQLVSQKMIVYRQCVEQVLHEHAMTSIKMAMYHLARRHPGEAVDVIKAVRDKVAEYV